MRPPSEVPGSTSLTQDKSTVKASSASAVFDVTNATPVRPPDLPVKAPEPLVVRWQGHGSASGDHDDPHLVPYTP